MYASLCVPKHQDREREGKKGDQGGYSREKNPPRLFMKEKKEKGVGWLGEERGRGRGGEGRKEERIRTIPFETGKNIDL